MADREASASAVARLSVPFYSGGDLSSKTRQAKETLGQRRIELDGTRDQVRQAVISAWGNQAPSSGLGRSPRSSEVAYPRRHVR
jgi:outer membrane protein